MRTLDGRTLYAKQGGHQFVLSLHISIFHQIWVCSQSVRQDNVRFVSELLRFSCLILCFLLIYKNVHGFMTTMMRINRVLHLKLDPTI